MTPPDLVKKIDKKYPALSDIFTCIGSWEDIMNHVEYHGDYGYMWHPTDFWNHIKENEHLHDLWIEKFKLIVL